MPMVLPMVFRRLEFVLLAVIAVADQVTKAILVRTLPLYDSVPSFPAS
jgi:hypothetical protein